MAVAQDQLLGKFKDKCKGNIGGSHGGGCTEGETVGVVSWGWRQRICIKGRAACPMVEKVGITPFRLAEREDWRETERGGSQ